MSIDVPHPLKSQMHIKKSGGDWHWIKFKYERLPAFCFYCGRIGHTDKFCEALFDNPEDKDVRKYDSSLRAQMQRQTGNSTNQWLRGPDGRLLNPVEGRGIPVSSQMDGMMRDDSRVVTVNGAVGDCNPLNPGAQVGTAYPNMASRSGNYGMGNTEGDMSVINTEGNILKIVPAREMLNQKNGLEIVDEKRHRVNGPNLNGLTEEQKNNIEDTYMTGTQHNEHNDNMESKNLILAGTAMQTRQSL